MAQVHAFPKIGSQDIPEQNGLTKREFFAALAMQGVEAHNIIDENGCYGTIDEVARRAVRLADALIEALDKVRE
jgi:hypothetical protein